MYISVMTSDGTTELKGVMLRDAAPNFLKKINAIFREMGHEELIGQMNLIFIACQALRGECNDFSFMAYAIPRLTLEERQLLTLQETREVSIKFDNGVISIDLDDFGMVNWIYIKNLPEIFHELLKCKNCIGNST